MFDDLEQISARPAPFEFYTAAELWTDGHTSARMLAYHLDESLDVASRRGEFLDRSTAWMAERFGLSQGGKVLDLGCGPGLYASRLARLGAAVTGVDFSPRSIAHAKEAARAEGLEISYHNQDYLAFATEDRFDLAMMIMCDFCALSPGQRAGLLAKMRGLLEPGGRILLDVYSLSAFAAREEQAAYAVNLMDGFWAPGRYHGFLHTYNYDDEKVVLDKYTIIEAHRTRTVYNWLAYFSPGALTAEVEAAGLEVEELLGDVAGGEYDPQAPEFAVVVRAA